MHTSTFVCNQETAYLERNTDNKQHEDKRPVHGTHSQGLDPQSGELLNGDTDGEVGVVL